MSLKAYKKGQAALYMNKNIIRENIACNSHIQSKHYNIYCNVIYIELVLQNTIIDLL